MESHDRPRLERTWHIKRERERGKINKNNQYLSFYLSVCQIGQLCLGWANDDDVYDTNSSGPEHRRRWHNLDKVGKH